MTKCNRCGLESEFDGGFIEEPLLADPPRKYCPTCWVQKQKAKHTKLLIACVAAGVVGAALLRLDSSSMLGQVLLNIFLLESFLVLTILPHELGHAAAARLLGWRVFSIIVGVGKTVFKGHLRKITFDFKALPLGGLAVVTAMEPRWFRLKLFLIVLAGPMVNVTLGATMLLPLPWEEIRQFELGGLPLPARLFLYANGIVLALNLWPRTLKTLPGTPPSDGKQLLQAFFLKPPTIAERCAARFVLEGMRFRESRDYVHAQECFEKGLELYPQDFHLLCSISYNLLDFKEFNKSREIAVQLFARETAPGLKRYLLLNNIAYVDALIGDSNLLEEADTYSQEVYAHIPWHPWAVGTRGSVLIMMGQLEAGLVLLRKSYAETEDLSGKAQNACFIAMAEARRGNLEEAEKFLQAARQHDGTCFLVEQTERAVFPKGRVL